MGPNNTTVLFAEFPDFSGLSADLSSKDFNALLKEYYQLADSSIRLHQGILSSFSGEKLMSVFIKQNNNLIPELLALEAVNELRESLALLFSGKKIKNSIGFKAGIACGNAIIGEIETDGKKQVTVMGEAVIRATRLSEFAEMEQILVGENIFKIADQHYQFQKLEPLPIRGKREMLQVYELLGKKQTRLRTESSSERKIASELVGRKSEIEQLNLLFKQLVAGKGKVVNIVGKAGIGKSRLMAEMKAQPIMNKVVLLEGRALSTGQNLSFHPIVHLIKSWAGITEEDTPATSSEKLQNGILRIAPNQADDIYAFLATMMSLPLTGKYRERINGIEGEALEKLILKNLRDLIINATKDKPRIYMIEDMHWSDSSSITIFESLYKLSLNYPVMFINVLRPGYKETGDYVLKNLVDNLPDNYITINVSPLEESDSKQLIRNLVQNTKLPPEVNETIIRKTQGNPFFIEEVIRSFLDEGIIEIEKNEFRITEKIQSVNIPETISDVILTRVEKLDEKTKELLKTASVIGRNFYYKVLEEATDTIGELDERLEYLKDIQLISESKQKEEIEYLFKHALAQQATYDSILEHSRKELHQKIASSIEKVFCNNLNKFYGTLVYHYTKAENQEKIIHFLILAGDESMKSAASAEALQFYKSAHNLIDANTKQSLSVKEIMDLEIKIAMANLDIGNNIEAIDGFEILLKKHFNLKLSNNEQIVKIKGIISIFIFMVIINNQSYFFKKRVFKDFDLYMKMLNIWGNALITSNPKVFAMRTAPLLLSMSFYNFRNSQHAMAVFTGCVALFNWTGFSFKTSQKMLKFLHDAGAENHSQTLVNYRMMLRMQNYYTGNWVTNEDYMHVYNTGVRQGEFWNTTIYTFYSGMVNLELGQYSGFKEISEKLEELADTFDNSNARAQKFRFLAMGYLKFREFENLANIVDEGLDYIKTTGHEAMLMVVYCLKTQLYVYLGKLNEAANTIIEAEKLYENNKGVPVYNTQYLLAKIKLDLERLKAVSENDKNISTLKKALKKHTVKLITQSKKNVGTLTEAYILKAKFSELSKKSREVSNYLAQAITAGEKFNARPDLSRAYFETGKFLFNPANKFKEMNGNPADYYLEKAKTMFEEMDLQWDLEEYKKFIKSSNLIK